jgi:hypothetical protein
MSTLSFSDVVRKRPGAGYVKVRMRVDRGMLALGVLKKNDTKNCIILQAVPASPDMHDVFLRIPNLNSSINGLFSARLVLPASFGRGFGLT